MRLSGIVFNEIKNSANESVEATWGKIRNFPNLVVETIESVDAFVKGDAVVLVNRETNEILTFLNKKGDRLSSKLKSELDLIRE